MPDPLENFAVAWFDLTLAFGIAFGLHKLTYPSSHANTSHLLAMKWLAWGLVISTIVRAPSFFHKVDMETFVAWMAVLVGFSLIGYVLGFALFYIRKGATKTKESIQSGQPSNYVSGAVKKGIKGASNFYHDALTEDIGDAADDKFFVDALEEVESGTQDKALWAKALVASEGDTEKCKAIYIKSRVKYLQSILPNKGPPTHFDINTSHKATLATEWLRFLTCILFGATLSPIFVYYGAMIFVNVGISLSEFYSRFYHGEKTEEFTIIILGTYLLYLFVRSIIWAIKRQGGTT